MSYKTWQALDAWGHPIPFHHDRYYACWNDPAWVEEVQSKIRIVINSGVDALLFGSPWIGGVPARIGHGFLGSAGCHNDVCQKAYADASGGKKIPKVLNLQSTQVRHYLQWRADSTQQRLQEWSDFAHDIKPDIPVFIESPGKSIVQYGHNQLNGTIVVRGDLPAAELVQNAGTLGLMTSEQKHIASMTESPKTKSIEAIARGVFEAVALGVQPITSGMGMIHQRSLTLLIRSDHEPLARMNQWLEKNAHWLDERQTNISPLAIYDPYPHVWWKWHQFEPFFWGACETVIRNGLPFRVVQDDDWVGVTTLLVPPGEIEGMDRRLKNFVEQGGRVLTLWSSYKPTSPLRRYHWPLVRRVTYRAGTAIQRWRYTHGLGRMLGSRITFDDPLHDTIPDELQAELVEQIGSTFAPRASGEGPLLFTLWREESGGEQWHLVNYQDTPQRVTLHAPQFVNGWVFTPMEDRMAKIFGNGLMMTIQDYKVLRLSDEIKKPG
jgi:hypothetical protein